MAERKGFLLRVDADLLDALARWAADDLRSLNGQIEFLLRRALIDVGRARSTGPLGSSGSAPGKRLPPRAK